jgi:hypothetical protein
VIPYNFNATDLSTVESVLSKVVMDELARKKFSVFNLYTYSLDLCTQQLEVIRSIESGAKDNKPIVASGINVKLAVLDEPFYCRDDLVSAEIRRGHTGLTYTSNVGNDIVVDKILPDPRGDVRWKVYDVVKYRSDTKDMLEYLISKAKLTKPTTVCTVTFHKVSGTATELAPVAQLIIKLLEDLYGPWNRINFTIEVKVTDGPRMENNYMTTYAVMVIHNTFVVKLA